MRPCGPSGTSDVGNELVSGNFLTYAYKVFIIMAIERTESVTMIYFNHITITLLPSAKHYTSRAGGKDFRTGRTCDINTVVKITFTRKGILSLSIGRRNCTRNRRR